MTASETDSPQLRDFMFPLFVVERSGQASLAGTAFVVGAKSLCLTSAHVLSQARSESKVVAGFYDQSTGSWFGYDLLDISFHPTEDVASFRLPSSAPSHSPIRILAARPNSAERYYQWGYPEDVAQEFERQGRAVLSPSIIHLQGYIRRRLFLADGRRLPTVRGSEFLEVSECGGPGFSGSPLVRATSHPNKQTPSFELLGIYVGERIAEDHGRLSVGYASPVDSFASWV